MTGTISPASPRAQAPPITRIGVRFPTNIASTCYIPSRIALPVGMRPSSSYSEVYFGFVCSDTFNFLYVFLLKSDKTGPASVLTHRFFMR